MRGLLKAAALLSSIYASASVVLESPQADPGNDRDYVISYSK